MSVPPLTVTAPQMRPPHRYIAIEGPIGALLLLLTGRTVAPSQLSGAGADALRVSRAAPT